MADVRMTLGGTTIILPVPASGVRLTSHLPSASLQTGDGHYGYQMGDKWYEIELNFTRLSATEVDELQSFYDTTALGETKEFTYTDPDSGTHTVRFLTELRVIKIADAAYSAVVRLRSEGRYS